MDRRDPPPTAEGWFALHDFRTVDWDAWRDASERERGDAIEDGVDYLDDAAAVADAADGASAAYAVLGHKADLLLLHLRPTMDDLGALERRFERTAFAGFTERATSYVSVTEASGYTTDARAFFEAGDLEAVEDTGLRNYLRTRLYPSLPDADHVCFYPMSKRRGQEDNWYDLPFDERAAHMERHGAIGREYAGEVTQMITGSVGFDDWEWGVTLWANDPTRIKRLLYEMRFDPSTSRYAEFGPFLVGRRLVPGALERFLAGERLGETGGESGGVADGERSSEDAGLREELAEAGVYAGRPHGEDVHALALYAEGDPDDLLDAVVDLRGNFDHYDTHVETAVYAERGGDRAAVVSIWETERAAETAAGYLADLPGVVGRADAGEGFSTMGLFYTVKPEHREEFVGAFDDVVDLLDEMDGHRGTALFVNAEDENDTFIASRWRAEEDARAFFRSEAFRDAVSWGREVLADRPRHVNFR